MARNPNDPNMVNSLNLTMFELAAVLVDMQQGWDYNNPSPEATSAYEKIKKYLSNEYVVLTNDVE